MLVYLARPFFRKTKRVEAGYLFSSWHLGGFALKSKFTKNRSSSLWMESVIAPMKTQPLTSSEFHNRIARLRQRLDANCPDWQAAIVSRKMSIYYLTGALVSGALWIPRDGKEVLFARRGFGQAVLDAACEVRSMRGFRDMAEAIGPTPDRLWMEKDGLTLSNFERFNQYFNVKTVEPIDAHLMAVRAVKSPYEIECLRQAGVIHAEVLEEVVPTLLTEGISEAQLANQIFTELLNRGGQGLVRLNMFETDVAFWLCLFRRECVVVERLRWAGRGLWFRDHGAMHGEPGSEACQRRLGFC